MKRFQMKTNEQIKQIVAEDIDWMWSEGHYGMANRLDRMLKYIDNLEKLSQAVTK